MTPAGRLRAVVAGLAALVVCAVAGIANPAQFFRSYLVGYLMWVGVALGSLAILMLYHLVGGKWGFVLRRILEAATRTFPLLAVLFLPIFFGRTRLFPWARPAEVAADSVLAGKAPYLNPGFFAIRAAALFAVWIALAYFLNRWSGEQDRTDDPSLAIRMQRISAPGLILYGVTTFFASVDWVMSLTPHWYSSIFGMIFMVGHGVSTMAFVVVCVRLLSREESFAERAGPPVFRDLGNLLFMFLMLWAYMAFSQLIITWSGNLPEEIPWYLPRLKTSWKFVSLALLLFYFGVPFLLLLSRRIKTDLRRLATVATCVLALRALDLIWMVEPAFHPGALFISWMDVLLPAGLGAVWFAYFSYQLGQRPFLALHDARMEGSVEHA
ncbi:MAG: hypothetical protein ACRD16_05630 [Thermoanaerobaculia bacterium]